MVFDCYKYTIDNLLVSNGYNSYVISYVTYAISTHKDSVGMESLPTGNLERYGAADEVPAGTLTVSHINRRHLEIAGRRFSPLNRTGHHAG